MKLVAGDELRGEGILAVTKALLQSGVSYVGGYQGSPISHLIDVFSDAEDYLAEMNVHFDSSASEASAAAMLAASVNYPMRGAVAWKSPVGTNVAADALANVVSAGVKGGALVILGEDYGEGSSIIQERSHAFAMKSQMRLLAPRSNHRTLIDMMSRERIPKYMLQWLVGMPAETQLSILSLILSGAFERLPDSLKFCFAHGGGSFAVLPGRVDNAWKHRDIVRENCPNLPSSYVNRFCVDSAVFDD